MENQQEAILNRFRISIQQVIPKFETDITLQSEIIKFADQHLVSGEPMTIPEIAGKLVKQPGTKVTGVEVDVQGNVYIMPGNVVRPHQFEVAQTTANMIEFTLRWIQQQAPQAVVLKVDDM